MENCCEKKKCGFATLDPERLKEISKRGGIAAQACGTAHKWTTETAREAGRKGGKATQAKRQQVTP